MSDWNQDEFLQNVREEFEDVLNSNLELQDEWWCPASEEWLADEVITQMEEDLNDDWDGAVSEVVIKTAMWTNDCWDICKAIIGSDDFANYRSFDSEPPNIHRMAIATLDNLAKEIDWKDILREWLETIPSPKEMAEELDKAMDKCRSENY